MKIFARNLCRIAIITACTCAWGDGFATTAANPRGASSTGNTPAVSNTNAGAVSSRVGARRSTQTAPTATTARAARPRATTSRAAATMNAGTAQSQSVTARSAASTSRAAASGAVGLTSVARSRAAGLTASAARSAIAGHKSGANVSRAAATGVSRANVSRATAVFTDISKIGGGYANCRDSYATCMDQFCANANDTYRRCFCSDKFTEFRDTEDALDQAMLMLMQFQDNNLNAVDKTAAEVNAMYTATEGEAAIKRDTSASAKLLDNISDLLSGKKVNTTSSSQGTSLGVLNLDFSTSMDNIWGGDGSSLFSSNSGSSMDGLEGAALYNAANKQCLQVMGDDACETDAVLNMAKSAYSIMITQDCNAYEKSVNSKKESVQQTVRTAEKYLREARLEDYRSHNSADVNECLETVRTAMKSDTACGASYQHCMDYTGAYINQTTGEPIYSPRLFQMTQLITLGGIDSSQDVLAQNPKMNEYLESKKIFANTALDSCRGIADTVWTEFKRVALVEIAQAQDEKIEEVKMSCVSTMAECYDTQSSELKNFDTNTANVSGAMSARAARDMCADKVLACAALYGDTDGCEVKDGKVTVKANGKCGLQSLLAFVGTVDSVRVAEGCATALETRFTELCTPTDDAGKKIGYPWACRNMTKLQMEEYLLSYASVYCSDVAGTDNDSSNPNNVNFGTQVQGEIERVKNRLLTDVFNQLDEKMSTECEKLDGYWLENPKEETGSNYLAAFYNSINGNKEPTSVTVSAKAEGATQKDVQVGYCYENTTRIACLNYNETDKEEVAKYDATRDECNFTDEWFKQRCSMLGNGYWENGVCYTRPE